VGHCLLPLLAIPLTFFLIPNLTMTDKIIDDAGEEIVALPRRDEFVVLPQRDECVEVPRRDEFVVVPQKDDCFGAHRSPRRDGRRDMGDGDGNGDGGGDGDGDAETVQARAACKAIRVEV